MSRFALWLTIACVAVAALGDPAAACSVCYPGAEESRKAFLLTTVFLSVLPLAMIGAIGWWVWRHARDAERADPH